MRLHAPHPNPATAESGALLSFTLSRSMNIRVDIMNLSGRRVRALLEASVDAGNYGLRWDGLDDNGASLPSGAYVVRLRSADAAASRVLTLLR